VVASSEEEEAHTVLETNDSVRRTNRWPLFLLVGAMLLALVAGLHDAQARQRAHEGRAGPKPAAKGIPPVALREVIDYAVSSNANIFTATTTTLRPTVEYPSVAYRVTVCLSGTNSVLHLEVDPVSTGTTRTFSLNSGVALTAGQVYTFTLGATRSCTYNLQCATGTTIGYLLLEEIRDGAL
jgi:hypothetical protein